MQKSSIISKNENIDSIAIGGFDGMHKAHQHLLSYLNQNGALLIVQKELYPSLTPGEYRCRYTKYPCIFLEFEKIKEMSINDFLLFLKDSFPSLKKIVVGYDFRFAKNRSGGPDDLKMLEDVEVIVVEEQKAVKISIHAKTIKEFLKDGNIKAANELLGREFSITAKVIKGQGLGRKKLFATFNLFTDKFFIPKEGVYITLTKIGEKDYPSLTFIGNRLTTDSKFSIETHILQEKNFENISELNVSFMRYLRQNRKFNTLSELKEMISKDIEKAKEFFKL